MTEVHDGGELVAAGTGPANAGPTSTVPHWRLGGRSGRMPGLGEAGLAFLGAAVVTFSAYGAQLRPGGFYNDDWLYLVRSRFSGGFRGAVRSLDFLHFRPLQRVYWPALFRVLGPEPTPHVAWTLTVASLCVSVTYLLLRTLGLPRLHATGIVLLAALFPGDDSTRFWPSLSSVVLAVTLAFAGIIAAVAAFRHDGRRSFALHGVSVALYIASVLLYEVAFSLILACGAAYVAMFGRRALRRWAVDVASVGAVLVLVTSGTFYDPLPIGKMPEHGRQVARDAGRLLADSLWAPTHPSDLTTVLVLCFGAAICGIAAWRIRRARQTAYGADPASELQPWLTLALVSLIALVASYGSIVPSPTLSPIGSGQQNRANVVAAMWLVALIYAVIMIATRMTARLLYVTRAGPAMAITIVGLVAVGYVIQIREDQRQWERASLVQSYALDQISRVQPRLPQGATVLLFGIPSESAPGIPIFAVSWDIGGALVKRFGDRTLVGLPVVEGSTLDCRDDRIILHNRNDSLGEQSAPYGNTFFVDANAPTSTRIANRTTCTTSRDAMIGLGLLQNAARESGRA